MVKRKEEDIEGRHQRAAAATAASCLGGTWQRSSPSVQQRSSGKIQALVVLLNREEKGEKEERRDVGREKHEGGGVLTGGPGQGGDPARRWGWRWRRPAAVRGDGARRSFAGCKNGGAPTRGMEEGRASPRTDTVGGSGRSQHGLGRRLGPDTGGRQLGAGKWRLHRLSTLRTREK
jgi:hypothetical protein